MEEKTGVSELIPRRGIKAFYGYEIQLIALKLQTRKLPTFSNNQVSYNLIVSTAMHSSLGIPFSRPPPPSPLLSHHNIYLECWECTEYMVKERNCIDKSQIIINLCGTYSSSRETKEEKMPSGKSCSWLFCKYLQFNNVWMLVNSPYCSIILLRFLICVRLTQSTVVLRTWKK